MESRQSTATSARAKTAVVLISDRPERFDTLRRAALPGRAVYLWLPNGHHAGAWPGALRGEPTDAQTYAPLDGREAIVVIDVADPAHAEDIAGAVSRALPLPSVLLIDRSRSHRRGGSGGGMTWIDEGELLADAVEVVLSRAAARKRVRGLRRALRGSASCAFLVQNDPDPDAIASALALRRTL